MATTRRLVGWSGVDPNRVDSAFVTLGADRLSAHGTSTTPDYASRYSLTTGPRWETTALDVSIHDGRSLTLWRTDDGWSATWRGAGTEEFELPDLTGALDCDLGRCPLTNTMPVLRHRLLAAARTGDRSPVELMMAWVSVPDLAVHVSRQTYSAAEPVDGGGALVHFESDDFATVIEFDADAVVRNYPGLAYRSAGL